jgi:hypothetical protein
MKHHIKQIGISLADGLMGFENGVRIVVYVSRLILDICCYPPENRLVNLCRRVVVANWGFSGSVGMFSLPPQDMNPKDKDIDREMSNKFFFMFDKVISNINY